MPSISFSRSENRSGPFAANNWQMMTIFHLPSRTRRASVVASAHSSRFWGSSQFHSRSSDTNTSVCYLLFSRYLPLQHKPAKVGATCNMEDKAMKIGIVGTGNIGASLARKLSAAGHEVRVANSRGVDGVRQFADEIG